MPAKQVKTAAEEWLTADELVAELRLESVGTLYEWRKKGKGPHGLRIGRHLRYARSDVNAWLADERAKQIGQR